MAGSIAVRVLGPIEAVGPQGSAILAGARQRSLLALLALQAGRVVPAERLIDGLWGEDPPRTALRTLQSHLARVRQALAQAGLSQALVSLPGGHVLRVPAESVDAHVFSTGVRRARDWLSGGDAREAARWFADSLALWRGEALQDGELHGYGHSEVDRLHDARADAVEDLCDALLRLDEPAQVVVELQQLLAAHPYRERAASLLMLGMYRCGRAADALEVYHRMRRELADGLGVDPGPRLQELYSQMLRQDPALDPSTTPPAGRVGAPAQLPTRAGYFTARIDEFADLDKLLAGRETAADNKLVVICGAAGMGKTALAVQWAHHVAQLFPDGQLFLDLRGHDPAMALSATAILGHLLRGLGVPADRVPADVAEQAGLYRSLVHPRRLLILLDNARTVDQVVPAIPAAKSSLLVVTSREELYALAVRQAVHFVRLPALDEPSGVELLRRAVDVQRVEVERDAASDLVSACGGMPLALRIVSARLIGRPGLTLRELAADLRRRQLDALAVPGDSAGIRAVFASAYTGLPEPVRRLFRLASAHPGPTFSAQLAAVAADCPLHTAAGQLATLAQASLLTQAGDRYRFHDLIRLYAAECADAQELAGAQERISHWYLAVAAAANRILDPARNRVNVAGDWIEVPFGQSHQEVVAFLEGEQPSLEPVVRQAAGAGRLELAWQLTYLVAGFYDSRGSHDRLEMCAIAVDAARRLGDVAAEVLMRNQLAATCVMMRRFEEALTHLEPALPRALETGDAWLLATTYANRAVANTWLRRFDLAQEAYERALAIHTASGGPADIGLALNNLGDIHRRAGRTDEALAYLQRGLELADAAGVPRLEAIIRHSLGQTHEAAGEYAAALREFHGALELRRQIGDRRGAANALHEIGAIRLRAGAAADSLVAFAEALELTTLLGNEHLEAVLLNKIGEARLRTGDLSGAAAALSHSQRIRGRVPDSGEQERLRRNLEELQKRSSV